MQHLSAQSCQHFKGVILNLDLLSFVRQNLLLHSSSAPLHTSSLSLLLIFASTKSILQIESKENEGRETCRLGGERAMKRKMEERWSFSSQTNSHVDNVHTRLLFDG